MKHIGGMVSCLSHQIKREVDRRFSEIGVSGTQMFLIGFLMRHEINNQPVFQRDIERELNIRASSVTSMIVSLESDGIICRKASSDGRKKQVLLTEKGHSLAKKNCRTLEDVDQEIVRGMTEAEVADLFRLLDKAINNLKGE